MKFDQATLDAIQEEFMARTIFLEVLPHDLMRIVTVGDWVKDKETGEQIISVADMDDENMNALILVHELIEYLLCKHDGVTEQQVDDYDNAHLDDDDPGLNSDAPYHKQHMIAFSIEILMAGLLGVDWKKYCDKIEEVFDSVKEIYDARVAQRSK